MSLPYLLQWPALWSLCFWCQHINPTLPRRVFLKLSTKQVFPCPLFFRRSLQQLKFGLETMAMCDLSASFPGTSFPSLEVGSPSSRTFSENPQQNLMAFLFLRHQNNSHAVVVKLQCHHPEEDTLSCCFHPGDQGTLKHFKKNLCFWSILLQGHTICHN